MWGNPTRERYYYFASGKFRTTSITLFSQEKYLLQHKIVPHKFVLKTVPQSVQLYGFAEIRHLEICATTGCCTFSSIRSSSLRKFFKDASKTVPKLALVFMPQECCCTACTDPYSTVSQQITLLQMKTEKCLLGICALALLEIVPLLMPTFLSQAISQLLLSSSPVCFSHIPKHVYVLFSFPKKP
jgi:hypothetical protein